MITYKDIYIDLQALYERFGIEMILTICAVAITTHNRYNWREIKAELLRAFEKGDGDER